MLKDDDSIASMDIALDYGLDVVIEVSGVCPSLAVLAMLSSHPTCLCAFVSFPLLLGSRSHV